jgi:hypothetical protein
MTADFGDPEAVRKAIGAIQLKLNVSPAAQLQAEVDAGLHPNLLTSQGGLVNGAPISVIEKYLLGATSFLRQPINYYDIFGAARSVLMTQLLGEALDIIDARKIGGAEGRLKRLIPIVNPDAYESTLLELIAGTRYASQLTDSQVDFIPERPEKTPDFIVKRGDAESFVECKKVARIRQISATTRALMRSRFNSVISHFRQKGISALFEVDFTSDPVAISEEELLSACSAAFDENTAIISAGFTVTANVLPRFMHDGPILYPSPRFSWLRYNYRVRSEWFGVVNALEGTPARLSTVPKELRGGISTWLLSVEWDTAVKWKISSPDVVGKYRRFAFDGVFDAIKQINNSGKDSTVHVWVESDYFVGRRREVMLDLFNRLNQKDDQSVGWIVLNETLLDVSPLGRFDLIEHAHPIQGPTATSKEPIVSGIFGGNSETRPNAEFGTGTELPDIDAQ